MRPDLHLPDQLLVGATEDADAVGAAVAREQQVVGFVDQHAGDARQIRERAQKRAPFAVEDVDAIRTRVRDIQPPAGAVGVGVVEAGLRAGRDRDEAYAFETHALPSWAT